MSEHGYVRYTRGCRCEVCRKAKADYMRERRRDARVYAQTYSRTNDGTRGHYRNTFTAGCERAFVPGIKHGRFGYEEHGCRCRECTAARRASDARVVANRRARLATQ